ncbi:MAG: hypothetical protein HZC41_16485 [Chloroflexi bacterium]|nr:hypothetical protein [Chloroflexota bacterium]
MAEQYSTRPERTAERTAWRAMAGNYSVPDYSVVAPLDRVRWASVLAGLFTTLSALVFFTVLGIAIGLSTFDANNPNNFGLGAGVYGAISALISFFLGGFISARTTAVAGTGNAILNGAMVWLVAIPLIVNILGTGIGTLLGTATDVATAAAGAAAEVAAPLVDDAAAAANAQATTVPGAAEVPPVQATVATGVEGAVQDAQQQLQNVTPQDVEEVARDLSGPAWGALLALGLSAGAAILGGLAGRRSMPTEVVTEDATAPEVRTTPR